MNLFNMAELFRQTKQIQEEVERIQGVLEEMTVEGTAGGGVVRVTANGKQRILAVKIAPEMLQEEDPEMLEDLITAAVNQALEKSQEMAQAEMQKAAGGLFGNLSTGGLKIPGLPF